MIHMNSNSGKIFISVIFYNVYLVKTMKSPCSKMMCLSIGILMLIAALPMALGGATESVVLGQYNVSFDLNTSMNHTIEVQPPIVSENDTSYRAYITFTNQTQILMGIDVLNNATDSTFEPELRYVEMLAKGDENATVTTRVVDNKTGIETNSISKSGDPTFTFRSWLDSEKCECGEVYAGTTKLEMTGIVPINISDNLLNTMHIVSLTNIPAPELQSAQPGGSVQLSGAQGAAIAKETQPMEPLNPTPSTSYNKPTLGDAWLNSFYPVDPAYYQLLYWANSET